MLIMYHSSLTLEYARGPNQGKREKKTRRYQSLSGLVGTQTLSSLHSCISSYQIVPYHRAVPSYRTIVQYHRTVLPPRTTDP